MSHIPEWMIIWFYGLPVALCVIGYTVRTTREIKGDIANRRQSDMSPHAYYYPSVTVSTIVGRLALTAIPLINVCAFISDLGIDMVSRMIDVVDKALDHPLVPSRRVK